VRSPFAKFLCFATLAVITLANDEIPKGRLVDRVVCSGDKARATRSIFPLHTHASTPSPFFTVWTPWRAAAVGMINAIGSAAGFAGPYLFGYLNAQTGSFSTGLALMMVSALASGLLILRTPHTRN